MHQKGPKELFFGPFLRLFFRFMGASAEHLAMATAAAEANGVPVDLFLGLIQTESRWEPTARSGAGALGLAQVMPWWAKEFGIEVNQLLDPATNLRVGANILAQELARFNGNWALAAMAYNGGAPMVIKAQKAANGATDAETVSRFIPAAETRAYWGKVLNWASYYAGQISATQAKIGAASGAVTEEVKENLRGISGATIAALLAVGVGAILFLGGRRG